MRPANPKTFMKRQDHAPLPEQNHPEEDMLPAGATNVVLDGTVIPPLSEKTLAEMHTGKTTLEKFHAGDPKDDGQP